MTSKYYENFKNAKEGEIIVSTKNNSTYRKLTLEQNTMFIEYLRCIGEFYGAKDDIALYNDKILCHRPFRKQQMRGIVKLEDLLNIDLVAMRSEFEAKKAADSEMLIQKYKNQQKEK